MIWNPWKKIRELEDEIKVHLRMNENSELSLQSVIKQKDAKITELEQTIALLIDGEFQHVSDLLEAKRKASLNMNSYSDLQNYANMVGNLRKQYPMYSGINAITGAVFK